MTSLAIDFDDGAYRFERFRYDDDLSDVLQYPVVNRLHARGCSPATAGQTRASRTTMPVVKRAGQSPCRSVCAAWTLKMKSQPGSAMS